MLNVQLKNPSHPTRSVPTAINCLATLLRESYVRASFVQADGMKLLIPLISPASTQQSTQLLYETCLCVWLMSYYDAAVDYLATTRVLPRLVEVVKGSTKEKVVRVIILTLKNLLSEGAFGAQMVDLGLPQIVQSLKAQAWSDENLFDNLLFMSKDVRLLLLSVKLSYKNNCDIVRAEADMVSVLIDKFIPIFLASKESLDMYLLGNCGVVMVSAKCMPFIVSQQMEELVTLNFQVLRNFKEDIKTLHMHKDLRRSVTVLSNVTTGSGSVCGCKLW